VVVCVRSIWYSAAAFRGRPGGRHPVGDPVADLPPDRTLARSAWSDVPMEGGAHTRGPSHLLVVEDDGDIRESLISILEREGFVVSAAADGREALARLREASVDLVLLDLMMPVMDGWQFRLAQKRDPVLAQIPVLAISADAGPKAAAIDAAAYLPKPFDYDVLLATIRRVLVAFERRRLQPAEAPASPGEDHGAGESRAEAERLRSAFVANLSHEIRTPLNAVLSLTELLLGEAAGALTEEQRRYLEVIARNGQGLLRLVSNVLDIGDLAEGKLRLVDEALALEPLVRSVVAEQAPAAAGKQLVLSVSVAEGLPLVRGDAHRIRQVLAHLVGNAIKFTAEGAVRVMAERRGVDLAVSVCDSGIGIPEAALPKIFEEFSQVDERPMRRHPGAGLGLALASRLVRLMGGEISVRSGVGTGSCFTFTLPRA
jgi:signal transduction histidine kinase